MFELRFETGNASFHEHDTSVTREAASILQGIAYSLEEGKREGAIVDWNGNTIGSWKLQEEDA
jgi:hypothetical protein